MTSNGSIELYTSLETRWKLQKSDMVSRSLSGTTLSDKISMARVVSEHFSYKACDYLRLTLPKQHDFPDFMTTTIQIWYQCNEGPKRGAPWLSTTASGATPWPNTEDLSWLPLGKGDKIECFWQKIVNSVNENTFGYQTWWWQPSIHLDLNIHIYIYIHSCAQYYGNKPSKLADHDTV